MSYQGHYLATRRNGRAIAQIIDPTPLNYKINRQFNTNFANISNKLRQAQRLQLSGSALTVSPIPRFNTGNTQFGNFYLGKPLQLNYLGRMEGMAGGIGTPPRNKY